MDEITGTIQRNGVNESTKEYDIDRNVFNEKGDNKRGEEMTRTRYKYMRDYNIDSDTEKKILDFCRTAKGEEQEDILAACVKSNKYIAHYIFLNLVTGVGYDRMNRIYFIPVQKVDFQGYRRLALKKLRDLRFKEEEESG
jgi:hypothetical protein